MSKERHNPEFPFPDFCHAPDCHLNCPHPDTHPCPDHPPPSDEDDLNLWFPRHVPPHLTNSLPIPGQDPQARGIIEGFQPPPDTQPQSLHLLPHFSPSQISQASLDTLGKTPEYLAGNYVYTTISRLRYQIPAVYWLIGLYGGDYHQAQEINSQSQAAMHLGTAFHKLYYLYLQTLNPNNSTQKSFPQLKPHLFAPYQHTARHHQPTIDFSNPQSIAEAQIQAWQVFSQFCLQNPQHRSPDIVHASQDDRFYSWTIGLAKQNALIYSGQTSPHSPTSFSQTHTFEPSIEARFTRHRFTALTAIDILGWDNHKLSITDLKTGRLPHPSSPHFHIASEIWLRQAQLMTLMAWHYHQKKTKSAPRGKSEPVSIKHFTFSHPPNTDFYYYTIDPESGQIQPPHKLSLNQKNWDEFSAWLQVFIPLLGHFSQSDKSGNINNPKSVGSPLQRARHGITQPTLL